MIKSKLMSGKFYIIIGICIFNIGYCSAQTSISGTIKDGIGKNLPDANVLLLNALDSSLVKGILSNTSGAYVFENNKNGKYLITASFTGTTQVYSEVFEINGDKKSIVIQTPVLQNLNVQMQAVTVTIKKPMFEQKIDRMVINVKNSITNAGGTALDVLEKSPGVTVNRQNNSIGVNGKNGVVVMINGKINYMPMDAIVQLLSGISSDNIEKIELITTPPSKYDAEGNAGYINIVLINNPYAGFNGTYFLSAGYGRKELGSAGMNFNYRNAKVNLFGDYSFNYNHTIQTGNGFTQFLKQEDIIANNTYSSRDAVRKIQTARIGLDYQLNAKTIVSTLISGYNNNWNMIANNGASVKLNNVLDTVINTVNNEINKWQNLSVNLNVQHTFKPGQMLTFDFNNIAYKDDNPNAYTNIYYNDIKQFLYHEQLKSTKVTPINFKVFSTDYSFNISKKFSVEAGAKMTFSKFKNDISLANLKLNNWVDDTSFSAKYLLNEKNIAAYSSFTLELNAKTTIKAGLRYEYTNSNLGTTKIANIVDRKYGQFFPTFYISQKINDKNSVNFSYSRRITRPTFNDLAPFTIFFDPKTFFTGNAALQPAIADAVQVSYIFKNLSFSLSYTHENNSIEGFQTQRVDTVSNILYITAKNFTYEQYVSTNISLPVKIFSWWNMQNNININWRQVNTIYKNEPVQLQIFDYNFNTTQSFTLPKKYSAELSAFYTSAGYFGTAKFKPLYQIGAGLQKKMNNNKDVFRFAANDIFNSGTHYQFVELLPIKGTIINSSFNFGTVSFKITFTHSFGNKVLKEKRDRTTGAEAEVNRVHN